MDASIVKSFEEIRESLIRSKTYEEIRACMDILNEYLSLADP